MASLYICPDLKKTKLKIATEQMNLLGKERIPFLFIIDFDQKKPFVFPLDDINSEEILFDVNGKKNFTEIPSNIKSLEFSANPVSEIRYREAFDLVQNHLHYGNPFFLSSILSKENPSFSLLKLSILLRFCMM